MRQIWRRRLRHMLRDKNEEDDALRYSLSGARIQGGHCEDGKVDERAVALFHPSLIFKKSSCFHDAK